MTNIHICDSRCNNDIDCEVCDHGVNIAREECDMCIEAQRDADINVDMSNPFGDYFDHEQLL